MNRIKTGIEGIDKFTDGFPEGRTLLVTGDAGSGKTILGLQFAYSCCLQNLKTTYITTEEDAEDLYIQSDAFNWDIKGCVEKDLLKFVELAKKRAEVTEAEVKIEIDSMKGNFAKLLENIPEDTKAVVIDNICSYTAKLTPHEFRSRLDLLVFELKKRNITSLIILDSATSDEFNEIALYSVYGAIKLMKRENPYTGRRERVMDVVKMRSTKTPTQFLTYEINNHGIKIKTAINLK